MPNGNGGQVEQQNQAPQNQNFQPVNQAPQNQVGQQVPNQAGPQGQNLMNQAGPQNQNLIGQQNQEGQQNQMNQPGDAAQQILQLPQEQLRRVKLHNMALWRTIAAGEQTRSILNYRSTGNEGRTGAAGYEKDARETIGALVDRVHDNQNIFEEDEQLGSIMDWLTSYQQISADLFDGGMTGRYGSHKDLENTYVALRSELRSYLNTHTKGHNRAEKERLTALKQIDKKIHGEVKNVFALMLPSAGILMNVPNEPLFSRGNMTDAEVQAREAEKTAREKAFSDNHMLFKGGALRVPSLCGCKRILFSGKEDQKLALLVALNDTQTAAARLTARRGRGLAQQGAGAQQEEEDVNVYGDIKSKLLKQLFGGNPINMAKNLRSVYFMRCEAIKAVKEVFIAKLAEQNATLENATQEQKDRAGFEVTMTKEYERMDALDLLVHGDLNATLAGDKYDHMDHNSSEKQAEKRELDEFYNTYFNFAKKVQYDSIAGRELSDRNAPEKVRDFHTRLEERAMKGGNQVRKNTHINDLNNDFDTVWNLTTTTEKDKKKGKKNFYNLISLPYLTLQTFNHEYDSVRYMKQALQLLSNIAEYKEEHSGHRYSDIGKDRINIVNKLEGELQGFLSDRIHTLTDELSADEVGMKRAKTLFQHTRKGMLYADTVAEISELLTNRKQLESVAGNERNLKNMVRSLEQKRDEFWSLSANADYLEQSKMAQRLEEYEVDGALPAGLEEFLKKKGQAESLENNGEEEEAAKISGKTILAARKARYEFMQKDRMQDGYKLTTGIDKNNSIIPLILQRIDLDESGNPLCEEDAAIHQANLETLRKYNSGNINDRREILEKYCNRVLKYTFDVQELDPDYFMQHYQEIARKYNDVLAFQNLIEENPLNKLIFSTMHIEVREKIEAMSAIFGKTSSMQTMAERVYNVNQRGRVQATFETGRENYKAFADTKMATVREELSNCLNSRNNMSGSRFLQDQPHMLQRCNENMPENPYTMLVSSMMEGICTNRKTYNHFFALGYKLTSIGDQGNYLCKQTREANTQCFVQDREQITSGNIARRGLEKANGLLRRIKDLGIRIPESKEQYALQLITNIGVVASRNELIQRTRDESHELTPEQNEVLQREYDYNAQTLQLLHIENDRAGLAAVLEELALLPENQAHRDEIAQETSQYTEEVQDIAAEENANFVERHQTEQAYENHLRLLKPGKLQQLDIWAMKYRDVKAEHGQLNPSEREKMEKLYPQLSNENFNRLVECLTLKPVKIAVGGTPLTQEDLENYRYNRQMIARFMKNDLEENRKIGQEVLEKFINAPEVTEDMLREDYLEGHTKFVEDMTRLFLCWDNLKNEMNREQKQIPGFSDAVAALKREHPDEFEKIELKSACYARFSNMMTALGIVRHGIDRTQSRGAKFEIVSKDDTFRQALVDHDVTYAKGVTVREYSYVNQIRMLKNGQAKDENGMFVVVQQPGQNQQQGQQPAQNQPAQGQQGQQGQNNQQ